MHTTQPTYWMGTTVNFAENTDGDTVHMVFDFLRRGFGIHIIYTTAPTSSVNMYADDVEQDDTTGDMYVVGRRMLENDEPGERIRVPLAGSVITIY